MQNTNSITVERKNVYGNNLIYPVCEQGKIFCMLLSKKTLSMEDLRLIQALGFNIDYLLK